MMQKWGLHEALPKWQFENIIVFFKVAYKQAASRQPALRNVPENWGAQFEWLLFYKLLSCCIKDTIPVVRDSEDIHQDMELNFQGNIHCNPKVVHVQVKFSVLNLNHLFWF